MTRWIDGLLAVLIGVPLTLLFVGVALLLRLVGARSSLRSFARPFT